MCASPLPSRGQQFSDQSRVPTWLGGKNGRAACSLINVAFPSPQRSATALSSQRVLLKVNFQRASQLQSRGALFSCSIGAAFIVALALIDRQLLLRR